MEKINKKTLEDLREYQQIILEKFLQRAERIRKYLISLQRKGIDKDHYIRVKGNTENYECDVSIGNLELLTLVDIFDEMKEKETITEKYEKIDSNKRSVLRHYREPYFEMEQLKEAYNTLKRVEKEIKNIQSLE